MRLSLLWCSILLAVAVVLSVSAYAAAVNDTATPKRIYKITATLSENGKQISQSRIVTQEGSKASLLSKEEDSKIATVSAFEITPHSIAGDDSRIDLDLRYLRKEKGSIVKDDDRYVMNLGELRTITIHGKGSIPTAEIEFKVENGKL